MCSRWPGTREELVEEQLRLAGGRPRLASNEVPPSLLDEVLPRFDASEVHDVWVAAPPQVAFAAVKQVTVGELRLLKPLEGMRARSPRARTPSSTRPSSARVARSRFTRTTAARRSTGRAAQHGPQRPLPVRPSLHGRLGADYRRRRRHQPGDRRRRLPGRGRSWATASPLLASKTQRTRTLPSSVERSARCSLRSGRIRRPSSRVETEYLRGARLHGERGRGQAREAADRRTAVRAPLAWQNVQPRAKEQNAFLKTHSWEEYAAWHLGLTEGAPEETKARYAFVYGDFRRLHRMGLIACHYRAAEWRHKEIELAAHELLQYLDRKSA
jgi:hypothetical protein